VHDVAPVGRGETQRDLARDVERAPDPERTPSDLRAEVLALDELEREVDGAVVQLSEVHRRHDVRVVDVGRRRGLALEPRDDLRVLRVLRVEHLHGERLPHHHVLRRVHAPDPAAPEQRIEPISPAEHLADERIALLLRLRHVRTVLFITMGSPHLTARVAGARWGGAPPCRNTAPNPDSGELFHRALLRRQDQVGALRA
jgi:hypothetical protein